MYKYINSKTTTIKGINAIHSSDRKIISDRQKIVEIVNSQFSSVFAKNDEIFSEDYHCFTNIKIEQNINKIMNLVDIEQILKDLNPNKALGPDKISPFVLKECACELTFPLKELIRRTISEGKLPKIWKRANVTPIFKSGSKLDAANYRPVSLTSIVCKIAETVIVANINDHMKSNSLFTNRQHGFMNNKSCTSNLLEAQDTVSLWLNEGFDVDVIYTDFSKAFDIVSHSKLKTKLEFYGISGPILNWVSDFLYEREQRVVLGEVKSKWSPVTSGIAQGSKLGPLCFNIFINDLPNNLINKSILYADDGKIFCKITPKEIIENTMQKDLNNLSNWCTKWSMRLNPDKCRVIHFKCKKGNESTNREYLYTNTVGEHTKILSSIVERDLGIMVSSDMKWKVQTKNACNKALSCLARIRNAFKYFDSNIVRIIYPTFVRPHIEFAIQVWNPQTKEESNRLEKIQKKALDLATNLKGLNYREKLERLGLTSHKLRRKRGDLIQMYKIVNEIEKVQLLKNLNYSGKGLRGHKLKIHREIDAKHHSRVNFLTNRIATEWNRLPIEVVESSNTNIFKNRLDKYLKSTNYRQSVYGTNTATVEGL